MKKVKLMVVVSMLSACFAIASCNSNDGSAAAESESDRGPLIREAVEPAAATPADPSAMAEPTVAARPPGVPDEVATNPTDEPSSPRANQIEEEMLGVITTAAETQGGDSCQQVYAGMEAMAEYVGDSSPDRGRFLEACGNLPSEVQRCMLPAYRIENGPSCDQAYANLDPALDAAMQEVWEGRPRAEQ